MDTFISEISNREFPLSERVSARTIRHSILSLIQKDHPSVTHGSLLSTGELNEYRTRYISDLLTRELGALTGAEQTILASLTGNTTITDKIEESDQQPLTMGQKISDKVAAFGGSWTFLISFGILMFFWIILNVYWMGNKGFDPYPFILLNLILSCIAAIQAPVIMMSQNRQEEKDRARGKKDYMINLKSELEIRTLHEKIDHFIMDQQQELSETLNMNHELLKNILSEIQQNRPAG